MAAGREWDKGFDSAWNFLLRWGFEAGQGMTGWNTLERSLTALVALVAQRGGARRDILLWQVRDALKEDTAPGQDTLDRSAFNLREKASKLRLREFEINVVDYALTRGDVKGSRELLIEIADLLSPETAKELDT